MSDPSRWFWRRKSRIVLMALLAVTTATAVYFALNSQRSRRRSSSLPTPEQFSRTDAWMAFGGDWTASSAEMQNNSDERGAKLMTRLGAWDNYEIQADVKLASPYGEAGLIIRSSGEEEGVDAYHGYFAGISSMDSSLEFGRTDFGWLPLLHKALPDYGDSQGWVHLRLVAVGCRFGVAATLPNGKTTSSTVDDIACIRSGRFGLRSYLTSAAWRNLKVTDATSADLSGFETATAPTPDDLVLTEPFDPRHLDRYMSSLRDDAEKHEIQPAVEPISKFPLSPGRHPNVTIQGVVISTPPLPAIQDETGAMIIPLGDRKTTIKLGDFVEATGTVVTEDFRSQMEDARIRVLWSDTPIPPLFVTASQLTGGTYRGRSIEVEGNLISATSAGDGYELILQDGNQYFRATGSSDFRVDPAELKVGSRLRLRGIATSLPQFTGDLYPFAVVTERIDVVSAPPWWSPQHVLWFIVACIALLILTQLVIHRLQKWHLRSVLREREELALEMHDTLAQSFTGIAYQLQAASLEQRGVDKVQAHIRNAIQMVQMSHKEASRTIAALRPQYRDSAGILNALKEAAERLSNGGNLRITTSLSGRNTPLPLEVTDALFRIGQEAVSNSIQHANCKELKISLQFSKREVQLCVEDDGHGLPEPTIQPGLGIKGMQSRAAKAGAHFDLSTVPGIGTRMTVTASLPIGRGLRYRLRAMLSGTFASASSK